MPQKTSVGIVYHFFAHYREPVLRALFASTDYDYWMVGDRVDPNDTGIRSAQIIDHPHFVYARSHFVKKRYLFQEGVLRFALRKDIDAIIYLADAQFVTTWFSTILARLTGKKVYFWTHGWTARESGLKDFVRSVFYRLAGDGLLLYGVRARNMAIEKGFDPRRVYVIYNSLDYDLCRQVRQAITPADLAAVRQEHFANPNLPTIICSSRLVKERCLDLLLDALGILKERGCLVNAIIVGAGPEKNALEDKAGAMNLPVKFIGACYDEKVLAGLFMAANITVVPSYLGLTAIHSLGYGTPVITNDNPDLHGPEWEAVQPGLTGDLYRNGDVADLAEKISHWVHLDPTVQGEMRARCIQAVELHYTPQVQRSLIEYALSGKPAAV